MSLLNVAGLHKRFGADRVLSGVSLQVAAGTAVALMGPSGGGKSTVLRCMIGLSSFDEGMITVAGNRLMPTRDERESLRAAAKVRRELGMIFQDFQLFPHMTVLQNVTEAPVHVQRMRPAEARDRARALLDRVGLADRADAHPRELSGGQKQRVAIARALAMGPKALLCDEITSALDPERTAEVLAVLEGLRRDGMTLLVVTHEIEVARRIADHVVLIAEGEVVEQGAASEVLRAPKHPRTARFLGIAHDSTVRGG